MFLRTVADRTMTRGASKGIQRLQPFVCNCVHCTFVPSLVVARILGRSFNGTINFEAIGHVCVLRASLEQSASVMLKATSSSSHVCIAFGAVVCRRAERVDLVEICADAFLPK